MGQWELCDVCVKKIHRQDGVTFLYNRYFQGGFVIALEQFIHAHLLGAIAILALKY